MFIPKRYGESKLEQCPFCYKQAIAENAQGFPVCNEHRNESVPELKCLCGEYLMFQRGKFGMFFSCIRCGNMNLKKALDINNISSLRPNKSPERKETISQSRETIKPQPKEITIRSDDPDYFDD